MSIGPSRQAEGLPRAKVDVEATGPVANLLRVLREGLGAIDATTVTVLLDTEDHSDELIARALVREVSASDLRAVGSNRDMRDDHRPSIMPDVVLASDTSFLGQLVDVESGPNVQEVEDVQTLHAILRGGRLRHKRAALDRLANLLNSRKALPSDETKKALAIIENLSDPELSCQLAAVHRAVPALARKGRGRRELFRRAEAQLASRIRDYWDGALNQEPVAALAVDERAMLLSDVPSLADEAVQHIAAIIEGDDATVSPVNRLEVLISCRHTADVRLVPALIHLLHHEEFALSDEAARALCRVADPRVHPALLETFEKTPQESLRIVAAGALGVLGDTRGASVVRELLDRDDPQRAARGIEALGRCGGAQDSEALFSFLDHASDEVVMATVRALRSIGDARALARLHTRANLEEATTPALWAEIEDAMDAITARMELQGEEVEQQSLAHLLEEHEEDKEPVNAISFWARFRAFRHHMVAHFWLLFGALTRATKRFEAASRHWPSWAAPHIVLAMALVRSERYGRALHSFRRALTVDRDAVERNLLVMPSLTKAFLRRAEALRREGRDEIAQALVEEVLSLDLRRAPGSLRNELHRLREVFRRRT